MRGRDVQQTACQRHRYSSPAAGVRCRPCPFSCLPCSRGTKEETLVQKDVRGIIEEHGFVPSTTALLRTMAMYAVRCMSMLKRVENAELARENLSASADARSSFIVAPSTFFWSSAAVFPVPCFRSFTSSSQPFFSFILLQSIASFSSVLTAVLLRGTRGRGRSRETGLRKGELVFEKTGKKKALPDKEGVRSPHDGEREKDKKKKHIGKYREIR